MSTLPTIDQMLQPITACLTPEVAKQIMDITFDDESTVERLEYLRDRANDGLLSDSERIEYDSFVEGSDVLMLLKEQVRATLRHG